MNAPEEPRRPSGGRGREGRGAPEHGRHARDAGVLGSPVIVVASLALILSVLGASVAVVAGVASGVQSAAHRLSSAPPAPVLHHATVHEDMSILTDAAFGPRYTNASWTVQAGDTVVVVIKNYDDGSAPLTGEQAMMFQHVLGTLGGTELVDGKPVSSVPNGDIAHTFTVVGLGLNLPIPASPTGHFNTVVARFVASRSGTFVWQCYAPCGSGPNLMGGPMSTNSWMEGTVRVTA